MSGPMPAGLPVLVLDTNIVLDLFVYEDPATVPLRELLSDAATCWFATAPMREELRRVLAYPQVFKRMDARCLSAEAVMANFDTRAQLVDVAPKAPFTCKDPDDQKFIDLAAAHCACLLSKDAAVLRMARRMERLGVRISRQWPAHGPAA